MKEVKIEGYWYSKWEPRYPMPVPGVLNEVEAETIFHLIKKKEAKARCENYRGLSHSRIEGDRVRVGSAEFYLDDWVWPAGFAEHYVLKHKVRPTDEFLKFIDYEN